MQINIRKDLQADIDIIIERAEDALYFQYDKVYLIVNSKRIEITFPFAEDIIDAVDVRLKNYNKEPEFKMADDW